MAEKRTKVTDSADGHWAIWKIERRFYPDSGEVLQTTFQVCSSDDVQSLPDPPNEFKTLSEATARMNSL
jgi:hypothetical protein